MITVCYAIVPRDEFVSITAELEQCEQHSTDVNVQLPDSEPSADEVNSSTT